MKPAARTFEDREAARERVPLMIGFVGPSGGGKTYSALRLATGIQRVAGGDIWCIDTEARRACHYADRFKFRHIPFSAPFSPLDYLAAIEHCVRGGAKIIIVDSMSHEHEGPGGVLEWHTAEVERFSRGDASKEERVNMLAWSAPKAARRRLINTFSQLGCNLIICFRAKEKLKIVPGKPPLPLGWMPIGGDEYVYEMTASCLLLPRADGVPTWRSEMPGEWAMMKLPEAFQAIIGAGQLDEEKGQRMAEWATGSASTSWAIPSPDGPPAHVSRARDTLRSIRAQLAELTSQDAAEEAFAVLRLNGRMTEIECADLIVRAQVILVRAHDQLDDAEAYAARAADPDLPWGQEA